ncbi:hypothetical protein [Bradyrhizobium sp. LTSP885]|uniref:hypothetical protein n=1 Tax=Bradyrhizobium sp. LTSP885 TaxID=1619232 RepID=UPI000ACB7643|nr:hypothetical protein [Bradyrhizobium sp. LTSP885]
MATALFILAAMFAAGFLSGYAMRAWRSQKRRARYVMHGAYQSKPKRQASTFGHPRRAF